MSNNHSFNRKHAKEYGIEEAIIIENLSFWIEKNKRNKKHCHTINIDGNDTERTFTYNSGTAFAEIFDYMTVSSIRNALRKLVDLGVLIKGNFNPNTYDRTNWYCFKDEDYFVYGIENGKCIVQNYTMEDAKKQNGLCENVPSLYSYNPDIKPDIKPDINKEEEVLSLTEKLQRLCKEKGISYTDKKRDDQFWQGKISLEMSKTNEQILEHANKFFYLHQNLKEFRPEFLDAPFGYELLYKKWDIIATKHLKSKPLPKPVLVKKSPIIESEQSTEDFMKDLEGMKHAS